MSSEVKNPYPYLDPDFLKLMNEIGEYGHAKYKEHSFHARALSGDHSRPPLDRHSSEAIIAHGQEHGNMYLRGELHDKFGTREHQLAASSFNFMMEFFFMRGETAL